MNFVDYLIAMRKSAWLIIGLVVVGALALAVPNSSSKESYRASVRFVVGPSDSQVPGTVDDAVRNLTTNGAMLKTFAVMLESDDAVDQAASAAGIDAQSLRGYTVTAFAVNETTVAQLEVHGPDAAKVGKLADGIGRFGVENFQGLYKSFKADPLDAAQPTPQKPQTLVFGFIGAIAGFVLGFLIAVARFAVAQHGGLSTQQRRRPVGVPTERPTVPSTDESFTRVWRMATNNRIAATEERSSERRVAQ